jgi:glycosyltransferase involved in cell wall biosynthesis
LRTLLDEADLYCLPSHTEGLPRSLVEAMARALPAVASSVGGVPELLDPACLVPPGDPAALAGAIGRLLADKEEWVRQSARNAERAAGFHERVTGPARLAWLAAVRECCGVAQ